MEKRILLWLEQMPLMKNGQPGVQGIKEYTWHTFTSFDEAFLTLYTTSLNDLHKETAIESDTDYFLNAARIYPGERVPPSVTLKSYEPDMKIILRRSKFDGDRIYGLEASLLEASAPIQNLFAPYLDEHKYGVIPIAKYNALSKSILQTDKDLHKAARTYLEDHFQLTQSFDYVRIDWLQGVAILYPEAATVTRVTRHPDLKGALRQLLDEHITPHGRMPDSTPDITEEACCIKRASNSHPVADLMMVTPLSLFSKTYGTGIHLHFEDGKFLHSAMSAYPELQLLKRKDNNTFSLALSPEGGQYWDYVALPSTVAFINVIKENERLRPGKQKHIVKERGQGKRNRK